MLTRLSILATVYQCVLFHQPTQLEDKEQQ